MYVHEPTAQWNTSTRFASTFSRKRVYEHLKHHENHCIAENDCNFKKVTLLLDT